MIESIEMSKFRSIFGEHNTRSIAPEYYDWKLNNNPFKSGYLHLEKRDGIVIGSASITPKMVIIQDEEVLAAEIGDTFTHPDYRRQGVFSRCVIQCTEYAMSQGVKIIYGTPNDQSLPGYQKKLNYLPCHHVRLAILSKENKFITKIPKTVAKILLLKNPTFHFKYLYYQINNSFHTFFNLNKKKGSYMHKLDIFQIDSFEDILSGLWGNPRYTFFNLRNATYLNWRFISNPDTYKLIVAKSKNAYLGYVVTKISNDNKEGIICDFITLNDDIKIFYELIRYAQNSLIASGAETISLQCVTGSLYYNAFFRFGYIERGLQPIILYAASNYGKKLLENRGQWHFTISDSDNI